MNFNKGISTPIAILLIIAVSAVVGVLVWQLKPAPETEPGPSEETTWECGDELSYEGQSYNTVKIGEQCWLAENLNVGTMIEGGNNQADNGTIEKYCYNDKTSNCDTFGGLYQQNEALQYTDQEGAQGICPDGWHIPTDSEWHTLEDYLATDTCNEDRGPLPPTGGCEPAEVKMAGNASLWESEKLTGHSNFGNSDLDILPAGNYISADYSPGYAETGFYKKGSFAMLWSSSKNWVRKLREEVSGIERSSSDERHGYSVRCLKDSE